ncbi:ATP-binding protein [Methanobrevibacter filiformis]|uniref:Archaeal ATPase n=1 Tax=Methanobrevibacter filiformis TaxID=55758 RepID=A0A162FIA0_9EURY|nr:ATP-binding protein [Methanobrevibacter filiformis]KZX10390.1 hypothetical protein MBFIL_17650 [Methanobrevibacter filiformis]
MIKRGLYINKIKPYMNKDIIKVLTGIRRCGKSTILKQLVEELKNEGVNEEDIVLINFELKEYIHIKNIDQLANLISNLLKKNKNIKYLLFDEIQDVEGWERLINAYFAEKRFDIYITGSNAKLLSGELATYLSGRYVEIKVYPFSFREFLDYRKKNNKINYGKKEENTYLNPKIKKLFFDYLIYGSMPSTLNFSGDEKIQVYLDLYNSIILKDIVKRNEIRDIELLNRIFRFVIGNVGQLFSANSIIKYLKKDKIAIGTTTIYNYLTYMEDAGLIKKVKREDLIGKRILNYIEKFYLVDLGFRQSLYGKNKKDIGQSLENIVFNELVRRGYKITIGKFKEKEVDFVCKKGDKIVYIQVAYILTDENTIKREFEPLSKINDNYPKYVLTMDDFNMSQNGINHVNIINFLLNDEI